jgi:hypothetical protein
MSNGLRKKKEFKQVHRKDCNTYLGLPNKTLNTQ